MTVHHPPNNSPTQKKGKLRRKLTNEVTDLITLPLLLTPPIQTLKKSKKNLSLNTRYYEKSNATRHPSVCTFHSARDAKAKKGLFERVWLITPDGGERSICVAVALLALRGGFYRSMLSGLMGPTASSLSVP